MENKDWKLTDRPNRVLVPPGEASKIVEQVIVRTDDAIIYVRDHADNRRHVLTLNVGELTVLSEACDRAIDLLLDGNKDT